MGKRIKDLEPKDFYVLQGPFRSGRQDPDRLAGNLIMMSIFLILFYGLMDIMLVQLYVEDIAIITIVVILNVIAFFLVLLSIIFSFRNVYQEKPAAQYVIVTFASQFFFGYILFWPSIFSLLDDQKEITQGFINQLSYFIIGVHGLGLILFIFACFRMFRLLKKGSFRARTKRDQLRTKLEQQSVQTSLRIVEVGISTLVSIIVFFNLFSQFSLTTVLLILLSIGLFFMMIFILPEQFMMAYCIKRFADFQLTKDEFYEQR